MLYIEIIRGADHAWRMLTGIQTQKRSEITPNLFLGGQYNPRGYKILTERGITGIVNMRQAPISAKIKQRNIQVLHLPTPDQQAPTLDDLHKGITFISHEIQQEGKVYVHCRFGEGRGPTMVIAYLMSTGMLYEDALALVKRVRPFVRPTKPQQSRLKELQEIMLKEKETLGDVLKTG